MDLLLAVAVIVVVVAAIAVGKSYVEKVFKVSLSSPKALVLVFVVGAWYFAYNVFTLALSYDATTWSEILMRSSFAFAGILMTLGPFLVLTPTRPIALKAESFFKKMVRGAQKKETRYTAFGYFCFITVLQGYVEYALYTVMTDIGVEMRLIAGVIIGYALVCLFYLIIFYSVMMQKDVVIAGVDIRDQIRRNMKITYGTPTRVFNILDNVLATKVYLAAFVGAVVVCLAMLGLIVGIDTSSEGAMSNQDTSIASSSCMLINVLTLIVFGVFILNVAFHPVSVNEVVAKDGTVIVLRTVKMVSVMRSDDRVVLMEMVSHEGDPYISFVRNSMRYIQDTCEVSPGYTHKYNCDEWGGYVYQTSDLFCSYFIATTPDYHDGVASLMLYEVSKVVRANACLDKHLPYNTPIGEFKRLFDKFGATKQEQLEALIAETPVPYFDSSFSELVRITYVMHSDVMMFSYGFVWSNVMKQLEPVKPPSPIPVPCPPPMMVPDCIPMAMMSSISCGGPVPLPPSAPGMAPGGGGAPPPWSSSRTPVPLSRSMSSRSSVPSTSMAYSMEAPMAMNGLPPPPPSAAAPPPSAAAAPPPPSAPITGESDMLLSVKSSMQMRRSEAVDDVQESASEDDDWADEKPMMSKSKSMDISIDESNVAESVVIETPAASQPSIMADELQEQQHQSIPMDMDMPMDIPMHAPCPPPSRLEEPAEAEAFYDDEMKEEEEMKERERVIEKIDMMDEEVDEEPPMEEEKKAKRKMKKEVNEDYYFREERRGRKKEIEKPRPKPKPKKPQVPLTSPMVSTLGLVSVGNRFLCNYLPANASYSVTVHSDMFRLYDSGDVLPDLPQRCAAVVCVEWTGDVVLMFDKAAQHKAKFVSKHPGSPVIIVITMCDKVSSTEWRSDVNGLTAQMSSLVSRLRANEMTVIFMSVLDGYNVLLPLYLLSGTSQLQLTSPAEVYHAPMPMYSPEPSRPSPLPGRPMPVSRTYPLRLTPSPSILKSPVVDNSSCMHVAVMGASRSGRTSWCVSVSSFDSHRIISNYHNRSSGQLSCVRHHEYMYPPRHFDNSEILIDDDDGEMSRDTCLHMYPSGCDEVVFNDDVSVVKMISGNSAVNDIKKPLVSCCMMPMPMATMLFDAGNACMPHHMQQINDNDDNHVVRQRNVNHRSINAADGAMVFTYKMNDSRSMFGIFGKKTQDAWQNAQPHEINKLRDIGVDLVFPKNGHAVLACSQRDVDRAVVVMLPLPMRCSVKTEHGTGTDLIDRKVMAVTRVASTHAQFKMKLLSCSNAIIGVGMSNDVSQGPKADVNHVISGGVSTCYYNVEGVVSGPNASGYAMGQSWKNNDVIGVTLDDGQISYSQNGNAVCWRSLDVDGDVYSVITFVVPKDGSFKAVIDTASEISSIRPSYSSLYDIPQAASTAVTRYTETINKIIGAVEPAINHKVSRSCIHDRLQHSLWSCLLLYLKDTAPLVIDYIVNGVCDKKAIKCRQHVCDLTVKSILSGYNIHIPNFEVLKDVHTSIDTVHKQLMPKFSSVKRTTRFNGVVSSAKSSEPSHPNFSRVPINLGQRNMNEFKDLLIQLTKWMNNVESRCAEDPPATVDGFYLPPASDASSYSCPLPVSWWTDVLLTDDTAGFSKLSEIFEMDVLVRTIYFTMVLFEEVMSSRTRQQARTYLGESLPSVVGLARETYNYYRWSRASYNSIQSEITGRSDCPSLNDFDFSFSHHKDNTKNITDVKLTVMLAKAKPALPNEYLRDPLCVMRALFDELHLILA